MKKILSLVSAIFGFSLIMSNSPTLGNYLDTDTWYVCFSSDNYKTKNENKMTCTNQTAGELVFTLSNKLLNAANSFYISNGHGQEFKSFSGSAMRVDSVSEKNYDILFSPDFIYDSEKTSTSDLKTTNCNITYKFHNAGSYQCTIDGSNYSDLIYNNQYTGTHDLFYYDDEKHDYHSIGETIGVTLDLTDDEVVVRNKNVTTETYSSPVKTYNGLYRIIFSPTVTIDGNEYKFNENGEWGTGTGFDYNVYVEEMETYYICFLDNDLVLDGSISKYTDVVSGKDLYALPRYEGNADIKDFISLKFFTNKKNQEIKYEIYQKDASGNVELLEDDTTTYLTTQTVRDGGWHKLHLVRTGSAYTTNITDYTNQDSNENFYIVGEFNNFGYDDSSNNFDPQPPASDPDEDWKFEPLELTDSMYNSDYNQWLYLLNISREDDVKKLVNGKFEFYITNGVDKYMSGNSYIKLTEEGNYKIYFSNEHNYAPLRNFQISKIENEPDYETIRIENYEDYMNLVESSKSTNGTKNKTYELVNDIDFKGKTFESIEIFSGRFNGNYRSFKNISYTADHSLTSLGVFNNVDSSGEISNLFIDDLNFDADESQYVGFVSKNYGLIKNVTVSGKIIGDSYVGGIAGLNGKSTSSGVLEGCKNNAEIIGKEVVGGVVGNNQGRVISCSNEAKINDTTFNSNNLIQNIGGVAGYGLGEFVDCENKGDVGSTSFGNNVGGIVGLTSGNFYFCKNYGNINGERFVGGIGGFFGTIGNLTNLSNNYTSIYSSLIESYISSYTSGSSNFEEETAVDDLTAESLKVVYLLNKGNVNGTNVTGGLFGQVALPITIKDSISRANVKTINGNYSGGLVGMMSTSGNSPTPTDPISIAGIDSCLASGIVEATGSISATDVGGLVGNLTGGIKNSIASCTIIGKNYLGGIAGNVQNASNVTRSTVKSNYSNCAIVIEGSGTDYCGAIAGFIEGEDEGTHTFGGQVQYNYFVSENLKGIRGRQYDSYEDDSNKHIAKKLKSDELMCHDEMTIYVLPEFNQDGKFYPGLTEHSYPSLRYIEERDTSYDVDFSFGKDFKYYYDKNRQEYIDVLEKYTKASVEIIFREFDSSLGDIDGDGKVEASGYRVSYIFQWFYGERIPDIPAFKNATLRNDYYVYKGDENEYFVDWKNIDPNKFENQIVDATYTTIIQSLEFKNDKYDALVGGEFKKGTSFEIKEKGQYLELHFYYNDVEINYKNILVCFKNIPNQNVYIVNDEGLEEKIDSEYIEQAVQFRLENNTILFRIENAQKGLPIWAIVLISVGGTIVACVGVYFLIKLIRTKYKNKKEKQSKDSKKNNVKKLEKKKVREEKRNKKLQKKKEKSKKLKKKKK